MVIFMPSSEFGEFRLNVVTCRGLLERTWLKALAILSAALNGSSILTIEIDRENLQFCQNSRIGILPTAPDIFWVNFIDFLKN